MGEEFLRWEGDMEASYLYTAGVTGERFFREIQTNGRLMGTYCPTCDVTYLPPRLYCEDCFTEMTEWEEVLNKGRVEAFTVVHVDDRGQRLAAPFVVALVRFPGAKGGLVHRVDLPPEEVKLGMEVSTVFRPRAQRQGTLGDILHFKAI